jgi:hypothetical protein
MPVSVAPTISGVIPPPADDTPDVEAEAGSVSVSAGRPLVSSIDTVLEVPAGSGGELPPVVAVVLLGLVWTSSAEDAWVTAGWEEEPDDNWGEMSEDDSVEALKGCVVICGEEGADASAGVLPSSLSTVEMDSSVFWNVAVLPTSRLLPPVRPFDIFSGDWFLDLAGILPRFEGKLSFFAFFSLP